MSGAPSGVVPWCPAQARVSLRPSAAIPHQTCFDLTTTPLTFQKSTYSTSPARGDIAVGSVLPPVRGGPTRGRGTLGLLAVHALPLLLRHLQAALDEPQQSKQQSQLRSRSASQSVICEHGAPVLLAGDAHLADHASVELLPHRRCVHIRVLEALLAVCLAHARALEAAQGGPQWLDGGDTATCGGQPTSQRA